MPWTIKESEGRYCVHRKTDDKKEACHDTMDEAKEHMAALYSSEKGIEKATDARSILESRIHESFTVAADQLFGHGVIDRPMRIELSGLIGDLLDGFGQAVGTVLEQKIVSDEVAGHIMTRSAVPGPAMFRGKDNLWNWIGIVSNNILDDGSPQHIISAKAHRFMVSAVDSGFYKMIYGLNAPPLWQWHLPFAIGETLMMAYDERGFMIAAGVQKPGHVFDLAFDAWAKVEEPIGMSHGVPSGYYWVDPVDRRVINGYLSEELTICPVQWSANILTAWRANSGNTRV